MMKLNKAIPSFNRQRRNLLQKGVVASGILAAGPGLWSGSLFANSGLTASGRKMVSNIPGLGGTLYETTVENDPATRVRIPKGFTLREIARTGQPAYPGSTYLWHGEPDGGATFPMDDGGWVYVSNSEIDTKRQGGVGAIRFNAKGEIIDSYSIASGTTLNCAGGPTPWGTWLSCEEYADGLVYECDPQGLLLAVPLPAMGAFTHEAVAVDPVYKYIYQTEDVPDGNFYRFKPDIYPDGGRADFRSGTLEVAIVTGDNLLESRAVRWGKVPYPAPQLDEHRTDPAYLPTCQQVPAAEKFNGGEGCWYHDGIVYFSTKGDNRVWAMDTHKNVIDLIYDKQTQQGFYPGLDDVDNVTVSSAGDILVAEDGAEMRLVVIGPDVKPFELVNILGHRKSEITGPAFSPDGSRLYFSSQSGPAGTHQDGRTYEMKGPFFS